MNSSYKIMKQTMFILSNLKTIWIGVSIIVLVSSCKKMVEVDPPITSTTGASVFEDDVTASAVLTGLYGQLSGTLVSSIGFTSISRYAGLSADELTLWNGSSDIRQTAYYPNALFASSTGIGPGSDFWLSIYPSIFVCNSVIDGLKSSNNVSLPVKNQLLGEAKFMRGLFYFYLVNLYGDVPLVITPDYKVSSQLRRSSSDDVYKNIVSDLKDAYELLSDGYVGANSIASSQERVRPNKWAASALLARTYLYNGDYLNAELQSTAVINNINLYDTVSLNKVFLKNSKEAIWQLQPVNANKNTEDGVLFIIPSTGLSNNNPVYLSSFLLNSFQSNDQRRLNWVKDVVVNVAGVPTTYSYPYKYKLGANSTPGSEYLMVLRLGEQYLIRAEARANLNKSDEAKNDLNVIRKRAGLPNIVTNSTSELITAIMQERRVELFTEWGHRWLDLKRTNAVDGVMNIVSPFKGSTWRSYQRFYPIPSSDIDMNSNLIQNDGY